MKLPGKGNSNSDSARPVHLIIAMIMWIRTRRLSIKKSLSLQVKSVLCTIFCGQVQKEGDEPGRERASER